MPEALTQLRALLAADPDGTGPVQARPGPVIAAAARAAGDGAR